MSKIGNKPIKIPEGVSVGIEGRTLWAKGKLGELKMELPEGINVDIKDGIIHVKRDSDKYKVMHGTTRSKINNMIKGVSEGFNRVLEVVGVGYRASVTGNTLTLQLGFSHPVMVDIPPGLKVNIDPKQQNIITISGIDKEVVGNYAARIKRLRPPEPYKGTGIRYQGEKILRKAGKAAAGAKK